METYFFHKELRKILLDKNMLMGELADKMGISRTYLSSLGKTRPVNVSFINRLINPMDLSADEIKRLTLGAWFSKDSHIINVEDQTEETKEVVGLFCYLYNTRKITPGQLRAIRNVLANSEEYAESPHTFDKNNVGK